MIPRNGLIKSSSLQVGAHLAMPRVGLIFNVNSLSKVIRHFSRRHPPVILEPKCPPPGHEYVKNSSNLYGKSRSQTETE